MNKSLNEYDNGRAGATGIYYGGGSSKQDQQTVIMEADEESYYQNESPMRGRPQNRNADSRAGFSSSPQ